MAASNISTKRGSIASKYLKRTAEIIGSAGGNYFSEAVPTLSAAKGEIKANVRKIQSAMGGNQILPMIRQLSLQTSFRKLNQWFLGAANDYGEGDYGDIEFDVPTDDASDLAEVQLDAGDRHANQISKSVVETSHKMMEAQLASTANLLSGINRLEASVTSGFDTLNNTLNQLIEITTKNSAAMIEVTAGLSSGETDNHAIDTKGVFKLGAYKKMVGNRLNESGMGMLSAAGSILKSGLITPEAVAGMAIEGLLDLKKPGLKKGLKALDDTVNDLVVSSLIRLGDKAGSAGIMGQLGKFLGIQTGRQVGGKVDKEELELKAVSFNSLTQESVVSAIPGYLRKILVQLGGDDLDYDFKARRFNTKAAMQRKFEDELAGTDKFGRAGKEVRASLGTKYNKPELRNMVYDLMIEDFSRIGTANAREKLTSTSGKDLLNQLLRDIPGAKRIKEINSSDLASLAAGLDELRANSKGISEVITQVSTGAIERNRKLSDLQQIGANFNRDPGTMKDSGKDKKAILRHYGIDMQPDAELSTKRSGLAGSGVDYTNMALYEIHKVLSTGINVYQVGREKKKPQEEPFRHPELAAPKSYRPGSVKKPKLSSILEEGENTPHEPGGTGPTGGEDGHRLTIEGDGIGTWGKATGKDFVQALFSGDPARVRDATTQIFHDVGDFAGKKMKAFFGKEDQKLNFTGWLKENIFGKVETDEEGNRIKKSRGILGSLDEYIFGEGGAKATAKNVKESTFKWFKSVAGYFHGDKKKGDGPDVETKRKNILGASLGMVTGLGFLGGPLGLIAGGIVGNALSGTEGIGDKIKDILFGKDYTDKKGREKHKLGILERVVNNITDPIRYQLGKTATALGALAKKNIFGPLANLGEAIKDRVVHSAVTKFGKVFGFLFDKGSKLFQAIKLAPWKLLGLGGAAVRGGATAATGAFGGATNFLARRIAVSDEAKAKLKANSDKHKADYEETIGSSEFYEQGGQKAWIRKQNENRKARGGMSGLMNEEIHEKLTTQAELTKDLVDETKSANKENSEVNAKLSDLANAGLQEGSIFTHDAGIHDRLDRIIDLLGGHYHKEEENQLANALTTTGVTAALSGKFDQDDAKEASALTDMASHDGVSKANMVAKVKNVYKRNVDEGEETAVKEEKKESFLGKLLGGLLGGLGTIAKNILPIVGIGAVLLALLKNGGLGEALGRLGTVGSKAMDILTGNNTEDTTTAGMNVVTSLGDIQVKDKWDWANPLGRLYHNDTDAAGNMIENVSANTVKDDFVQQNLRRDLMGSTWNNLAATSGRATAENLTARAAAQRAQGGLGNRMRAKVNEVRAENAQSRAAAAEEAANAPKTSFISGLGRNIGRIGVIGGAGAAAGGIAGGIATMAGADEDTAAMASRVANAGTAGALTVNMARSAVTPGKKALVDKILDGIIKMVKFIGEKIGADKALKAVGSTKVITSLTSVGSKIVNAVKNKFDDVIMSKIEAKLVAVGGKNALTVATAGLAVAGGAIVGLASGLCDTEHLFGIMPGESDALMKTISGIFGAAFGALEMTPLGWIVVIFDVIDAIITAIPGFDCGIKQLLARKVYELMGGQENLAEKQAAFAAEKAYTEQKYGITYSNDATFNDEVNGGGLLGNIWHGGTELDEEGHVRRDAAGAVIHDGGLKGLVVGGEKKYATDENGQVLRDENGNAIQAIDKYGNALKEDAKWGDAVGKGFNAIGGFLGGRKIYKTDENGNVMYDENNKPIVEGEEKNIIGKAGDALISAKNAAGDFIKNAGDTVGGFLGDAKDAVGKFLFGDKKADPEKAAELSEIKDDKGNVTKNPLSGLIGQVNSTLSSKLSALSGDLAKVNDAGYELDENGKPLLDENGQKIVKGGLGGMLQRTIGGIGSSVAKTIGGVLDAVKEKGVVGAAKDGLKNLAGNVGDFFSNILGGSKVSDKKGGGSNYLALAGRGEDTDAEKNVKFDRFISSKQVSLTDRYIRKLSPVDTERLVGSNSTGTEPVKNLFYQGNYSKAKHMSDAGCGPISAAFMTSLYGRMLTPMTAAEIMSRSQHRDAGGATSLEGIEHVGETVGVDLESSRPRADLLVSKLRRGEPVILLGKSDDPDSPYTTSGHYVVATGMDRNGYVSVMNPLSKIGRKYKLQSIMTGAESMTYTKRSGLPELITELPAEAITGRVANTGLRSITSKLRTFAPIRQISKGIETVGSRIVSGAKNVISTIGSNLNRLFGRGEAAGGYGSPGENEKVDLLHNFPIYHQGGSAPWAKLPYTYPGGDQSMTMAKAACGPTSMAMILAGASGKHFSPAVAAKYSMEHGYRVNGGTSHAFFKNIGDQYDLNTSQRGFNQESLDSSLAAGKPVIVSGRGARPFTKGGHFVTVVGKENGKYLVNDPANHSGAYGTLSGASNMWAFEKKDGSPILGRTSYLPGTSSGETTSDAENSDGGSTGGIFGIIGKTAKDIINKFKATFGLDILVKDDIAEDDRDPENDTKAPGNNSVAHIDGPVEYLTTAQVAAIQTKREAKEIIDLKTMKTITFSWAASANYHSDCTPMTPADVQTIKDILHPGGGVDWNNPNSWSWDGRPGILKLNGRMIACGFHLRPHAAMMGGNPGAPFANKSNTPWYYSKTQKWPLGGHICCYYGDSPGGTQSCNAAAKEAYKLGNEIFKKQTAKKIGKTVNKIGLSVANPLLGKMKDATGAEEGIGGGYGDASPLNKKFHVTSPFGPRWGRQHNGVDLAPDDHSRQAEVQVTTPGTVASKGYDNSAGNYVTISGNDGRLYQYYHLKKTSSLQSGQSVQAGATVGEMGSTGHSTGPHLHYGVKENGKFIDPAPLISSPSVNTADLAKAVTGVGASMVNPLLGKAIRGDLTSTSGDSPTDSSGSDTSGNQESSVIGQGLAMIMQTAKDIGKKFSSILGLDAISGESSQLSDDGTNNSSSDSGSDNDLGEFKSVAGDMAATIYNFLTSRGCSTAAACGVLGNCQQESSLRPDAKQSGGPGRGLFQWEKNSGRFANLEKIARDKGKPWTDTECQLLFLWQEMTSADINSRFKGKYANTTQKYKDIFEEELTKAQGHGLPGGLEDWKKLTDVKLATSNFEGAYERAGTPAMENRWKYAQAFYDRFSKEAKVSPVSKMTKHKKDMAAGDDLVEGVGGADRVPGEAISPASSAHYGAPSKIKSGRRSTWQTPSNASKPIRSADLSSRYASVDRSRSSSIASSAVVDRIRSKLASASSGIKTSVARPAPNSDEWTQTESQAPNLQLLEETLGQVLVELQAINANTSGANDYLGEISKKDFGGSLGGESGRQLSRALQKQTQRPKGANPFPYNARNVSSVMSIVRPT